MPGFSVPPAAGKEFEVCEMCLRDKKAPLFEEMTGDSLALSQKQEKTSIKDGPNRGTVPASAERERTMLVHQKRGCGPSFFGLALGKEKPMREVAKFRLADCK